MNRTMDAKLLVNIAKNTKYIPSIIGNIKNWPTYFLYYLGLRKGGAAFFFRNGATIRDQEGTASGTKTEKSSRQRSGVGFEYHFQ